MASTHSAQHNRHAHGHAVQPAAARAESLTAGPGGEGGARVVPGGCKVAGAAGAVRRGAADGGRHGVEARLLPVKGATAAVARTPLDTGHVGHHDDVSVVLHCSPPVEVLAVKTRHKLTPHRHRLRRRPEQPREVSQRGRAERGRGAPSARRSTAPTGWAS